MKTPFWCTVLLIGFCSGALADGSSIDTIYQPYVQPLEKELEYQLRFEDENATYQKTISRHRLGYGQAVSDRLFLEASLTFSDADSLELERYELEGIYQLTEQGEYSSDWGLLIELEKLDGVAIWEASAGLLNSFNYRRWQFTSNLLIEYEWGNDVDNEFETAFAAQALYRYRPEVEPGIEFFVGEDTLAIGPVVRGMWRSGGARKMFWSLALLFGSDETPDHTVKFELEYEFF